jgi:hypothetical protein
VGELGCFRAPRSDLLKELFSLVSSEGGIALTLLPSSLVTPHVA